MPSPYAWEVIANHKQGSPQWVQSWVLGNHTDYGNATDLLTDNGALRNSRDYLGSIMESTLHTQRVLEVIEMHLHNISDSLEKISNPQS